MKLKIVTADHNDECVRSFRVTVRDKDNPDLAAGAVSKLIQQLCEDRGAVVVRDGASLGTWNLDITTDDMEAPL